MHPGEKVLQHGSHHPVPGSRRVRAYQLGRGRRRIAGLRSEVYQQVSISPSAIRRLRLLTPLASRQAVGHCGTPLGVQTGARGGTEDAVLSWRVCTAPSGIP